MQLALAFSQLCAFLTTDMSISVLSMFICAISKAVFTFGISSKAVAVGYIWAIASSNRNV